MAMLEAAVTIELARANHVGQLLYLQADGATIIVDAGDIRIAPALAAEINRLIEVRTRWEAEHGNGD